MIPLRITAKAADIVYVMGIAATVASKEVRSSFLRTCVTDFELHFLRFTTAIFFAYAVMATCPQGTSTVETLITVFYNSPSGKDGRDSAQQRPWTKKYSLQRCERYVWRHFLSVRAC